VFIVEIMGQKVGSLTLHAGLAGGADIILIPEIPYDIKKIIAAINRRAKAGKRFTILAVAEGAISKEDAELPKKKYKEKLEERAKKYPSVSYEIADRIFKETGSEVRITVPGHTQRGGEPCAYDRVLSTRIGAGAAQAIIDEEYGVMIGIVNGKIKRVPLAECAGKLKMVSPKDQTVKAAKQIGISFGD
jgi:6-phosphofructokinase 1